MATYAEFIHCAPVAAHPGAEFAPRRAEHLLVFPTRRDVDQSLQADSRKAKFEK
jgi:hypothetical protein